jgi:translocation protein SEC66
MANNQLAKQRMEEIQSKLPEEKEWWEKKKAGIQSQFMKELEEEAAGSRQGSVTSAPTSRKGSITPATPQKANSDESAVLTETPGSAKKKKKSKN